MPSRPDPSPPRQGTPEVGPLDGTTPVLPTIIDLSEPVPALGARPQASGLGVQVPVGESLVEHRLEDGELHRLLDEVEGAFAHRLDGQRHAAVPGEHHDLDERIGVLQLPQHVEPVLIG